MQPLGALALGDDAEVAGDDGRPQVATDVGGRGVAANGRRRSALGDVVGRQAGLRRRSSPRGCARCPRPSGARARTGRPVGLLAEVCRGAGCRGAAVRPRRDRRSGRWRPRPWLRRGAGDGWRRGGRAGGWPWVRLQSGLVSLCSYRVLRGAGAEAGGLLDAGGGDPFDDAALEDRKTTARGSTTTVAPARSRPYWVEFWPVE